MFRPIYICKISRTISSFNTSEPTNKLKPVLKTTSHGCSGSFRTFDQNLLSMTSLERPAQSAIRQYAERRSQAEAQLACVTKAFQKEGVRGSRSTYSLQVSTIKGHIQESRPDVRNLCFGLLGPPFSAVNMEKQLRIKLAASSKPFCQSGKTPVTDLIHLDNSLQWFMSPGAAIQVLLQNLLEVARPMELVVFLHCHCYICKKCIHIFV